MILIGISGKKGVGKDLLASFLKQKYGFIPMSFAQELKAAVRRDFDFTEEHTDGMYKEFPQPRFDDVTPRDIMTAYGQFFRQFDSNWWVKSVFDKIAGFISQDDLRIAITDVRFRNEADMIRERGGLVVRLNRPQSLNIYKTPSTDISETELDDYKDFAFELPEEQNLVPTDLSLFADKITDFALSREASIKYGFMA